MFKCRHHSRGYVTLRYTADKKCWLMTHGYDHANVFTLARFYLWKSAILECIQIPQLGLVNWCCYKFYTVL